MSQLMYLKPEKNICCKNLPEMHLWSKISQGQSGNRKKTKFIPPSLIRHFYTTLPEKCRMYCNNTHVHAVYAGYLCLTPVYPN